MVGGEGVGQKRGAKTLTFIFLKLSDSARKLITMIWVQDFLKLARGKGGGGLHGSAIFLHMAVQYFVSRFVILFPSPIMANKTEIGYMIAQDKCHHHLSHHYRTLGNQIHRFRDCRLDLVTIILTITKKI